MARTGDKKAFCVLEFAKTESIVTAQQRFWTKYDIEPPMDKTIYEWYKKFQQSGYLCTAKWRAWPGPSAETADSVQPVFFHVKMFAQNAPDTWLRHLQFPGSGDVLTSEGCWQNFLYTLDSLGVWPQATSSFRSTQAAILLEFFLPLTNCFVHRWFCVVVGPKPSLPHHNWLSFDKFQEQNTFSSPALAIFRHNCPIAVKPASMPWHLLPKQTWRDYLPIDMLFSVVSALVVALPSSEVPEGLMNYPLFMKACIQWWFLCR
jgi:hypothetical protein